MGNAEIQRARAYREHVEKFITDEPSLCNLDDYNSNLVAYKLTWMMNLVDQGLEPRSAGQGYAQWDKIKVAQSPLLPNEEDNSQERILGVVGNKQNSGLAFELVFTDPKRWASFLASLKKS